MDAAPLSSPHVSFKKLSPWSSLSPAKVEDEEVAARRQPFLNRFKSMEAVEKPSIVLQPASSFRPGFAFYSDHAGFQSMNDQARTKSTPTNTSSAASKTKPFLWF